jgi:PKD domain
MHTYSAAGNYTVKLTASNADRMDTNTSEIIVQGAPPKILGGFNSLIFVMIVSYLCKKSARNSVA